MFKSYDRSSNIIFGGASISGEGRGYGFGDCNELKAQELIEYAYSSGINIFDSAPIYGFDLCEKRLGRYLKNLRDKVKIVSKSGVDWHPNGRVNMTNDPAITQKMLEKSLKNFDLGYIDIYFIHWPDSKVDIRFSLEYLEKQRSLGLIKAIGLCNTNNDDLKKALSVCDISVVQNECNLFNNSFKTLELSDKVQTWGWGTLDKGILSGKMSQSQKFHKDDARSWAPWWKKSNWKEKVKTVDKFKELYPDIDIKHLALSYSLGLNNKSICGFSSVQQLSELVSLEHSKIDKFDYYIQEFNYLL